jgi:hypothetical protein
MMRAFAAVVVLALGPSASVLAAGGAPDSVQLVHPMGQSIERAARMACQGAGVTAPEASQRGWAGRHPVALGMMIGLAGGIAVGSAQHYEGKRPFGPFMALGGGIGVGIGAGVGAVVSVAKSLKCASAQDGPYAIPGRPIDAQQRSKPGRG